MYPDLYLIIRGLINELAGKHLLLEDLVNKQEFRKAAEIHESIFVLESAVSYHYKLAYPHESYRDIYDETRLLLQLIKKYSASGLSIEKWDKIQNLFSGKAVVENGQEILEVLAKLRADQTLTAIIHLDDSRYEPIRIRILEKGVEVHLRNLKYNEFQKKYGLDRNGTTILDRATYSQDFQVLEVLAAIVYEVLGYHSASVRVNQQAAFIELVSGSSNNSSIQ